MRWHAMWPQGVAIIINIMTSKCNKTQYMQLLYEHCNSKFLLSNNKLTREITRKFTKPKDMLLCPI